MSLVCIPTTTAIEHSPPSRNHGRTSSCGAGYNTRQWLWNASVGFQSVKDEILKNAEVVGDVHVAKLYGPVLADVVKGIAFAIKADAVEKTVLLAATHDNGKPMLTVMISDDLVKDGLNAGKIVREAAKLIQGGGGGQPHFAQAGGRNVDGLSAALDKMRELLDLH